MNVKRLLSLLLCLLMLTISATAEVAEEALPNEALYGLWVADANEAVELRITPGSYAPLGTNAAYPDLYADGYWRFSDETRVTYMLMIDHSQQYQPGILELIGLNPTAAKVLREWSEGTPASPNLFRYQKSAIYASERVDGGWDDTLYTDKNTGMIYAERGEDGEARITWMDEYDPHLFDIEMHRVTTETPSAEELTREALRPVIEREIGAEAKAALAVMKYAKDAHLSTADADALQANLAAAFDGLSDADRQALAEGFAVVGPMIRDTLMLDPKHYDSRWYDPFKELGLMEVVAEIFECDALDQYSVGLMYNAIAERAAP